MACGYRGLRIRLFKLKEFSRRARKERVTDDDLRDAVARANRGQIAGEIGKFLIKQRIARPRQGRRGGYRAIIVHVPGKMAVFLHLFPKSAKANLTASEEDAYREAAKHIEKLDAALIAALVRANEWIEVEDESDQKAVPERPAPERPLGDERTSQGRRRR
jgi:hypothetical protein